MHCKKKNVHASAGRSTGFFLTPDVWGRFCQKEKKINKNDEAPALQFGDATYSEIGGIQYSDEGLGGHITGAGTDIGPGRGGIHLKQRRMDG